MRTLRAVKPNRRLPCLGVTTAFVYASIVYLYPLFAYRAATRAYDLEQLSAGRAWAAGIYVRGAAHCVRCVRRCFFLVPRLRRPLGAVVGFGLLFAFILIWIYPITAIDVFYYVLQGRQEVIYGLNPLSMPASLVPGDPLVPFVGEWSAFPSPYGPLWGVLSALVVRLGFGRSAMARLPSRSSR